MERWLKYGLIGVGIGILVSIIFFNGVFQFISNSLSFWPTDVCLKITGLEGEGSAGAICILAPHILLALVLFCIGAIIPWLIKKFKKETPTPHARLKASDESFNSD